MEWMLYLIVLVPMFFLPTITWDIFTLPQTTLLALLSVVGIAGLGVLTEGQLSVSLPVLLSLMLVFYMSLNTLWTEVLDGARKEFILQFSFLIVFILAAHSDIVIINKVLIVAYCASFLIQLYTLGQVFGIDWIFPHRLREGFKSGVTDSSVSNSSSSGSGSTIDCRPIGTIGNTNFFSSYVIVLFWIGIYLGIAVTPFFLIGNGLFIFLLYKTGCRGAWLGLLGSGYVFILLLALTGYTSKFFGYYNNLFTGGIIYIGFIFCCGVIYWLVSDWKKINGTKIDHTKDEGRLNPNKARIATLRYRLSYWRAGWELFKAKPFQGNGLRSYRKLVYYAQAKINDKNPDYLHPFRYITAQPRECHNDWLEDLVELGIAGVIVRFGLIGSVFYFGISSLLSTGNIQLLCLLSVMVACCIHSIFFFGLRLPSTGMIFWLVSGFVIVLSNVPTRVFIVEPWIFFLLIPIFGVLCWETTIKASIASYFFMKFNKGETSEVKEKYCLLTIKWAPDETIYTTHAMIGHMKNAPQIAYKFAEQMWSKFDGMTPGWIMHYNMGNAAEISGNKELAHRHYATSYRLLPYFEPAIEKLKYLERFIPFPDKGGEQMKQVSEEAKLNVLLLHQKMQTLERDTELLRGQVQIFIMRESSKLNIPEDHHYALDEGMFLSPEEHTEYQKSKAKQMQQPPLSPNQQQQEGDQKQQDTKEGS